MGPDKQSNKFSKNELNTIVPSVFLENVLCHIFQELERRLCEVICTGFDLSPPDVANFCFMFVLLIHPC